MLGRGFGAPRRHWSLSDIPRTRVEMISEQRWNNPTSEDLPGKGLSRRWILHIKLIYRFIILTHFRWFIKCHLVNSFLDGTVFPMTSFYNNKLKYLTDITQPRLNICCQTRWIQEINTTSWWWIQHEVMQKLKSFLSVFSQWQLYTQGMSRTSFSENEMFSSFIPDNSSIPTSTEPRKFSKYNPNQSRRSIQPQNIYTRNQQLIENQRNHDRKSGYMMAVGGGNQNIGSNGYPPKPLYPKNTEIQSFESRSTIPHGKYIAI